MFNKAGYVIIILFFLATIHSCELVNGGHQIYLFLSVKKLQAHGHPLALCSFLDSTYHRVRHLAQSDLRMHHFLKGLKVHDLMSPLECSAGAQIDC